MENKNLVDIIYDFYIARKVYEESSDEFIFEPPKYEFEDKTCGKVKVEVINSDEDVHPDSEHFDAHFLSINLIDEQSSFSVGYDEMPEHIVMAPRNSKTVMFVNVFLLDEDEIKDEILDCLESVHSFCLDYP